MTVLIILSACSHSPAFLITMWWGKGAIRAIRDKYPNANIVAADYDPGISEVNCAQLH